MRISVKVDPLFWNTERGEDCVEPSLESKTVLNGRNFFQFCNLYADKLWVITYTANPNLYLIPIVEKLIYNIGDYPAESKIKVNIHTKLYILFRSNKVWKVFIGSQNLVLPCGIELMTLVDKKENKKLKEYFLNIWRQFECKNP
jgi:hypothetical protein